LWIATNANDWKGEVWFRINWKLIDVIISLLTDSNCWCFLSHELHLYHIIHPFWTHGLMSSAVHREWMCGWHAARNCRPVTMKHSINAQCEKRRIQSMPEIMFGLKVSLSPGCYCDASSRYDLVLISFWSRYEQIESLMSLTSLSYHPDQRDVPCHISPVTCHMSPLARSSIFDSRSSILDLWSMVGTFLQLSALGSQLVALSSCLLALSSCLLALSS
jgi:hypothetical protein